MARGSLSKLEWSPKTDLADREGYRGGGGCVAELPVSSVLGGID